jgi:O-antigen ligase
VQTSWEWPLLLALVLAPLQAGGLEPAPGAGIAGLVWLALLLRLALPAVRREPLTATPAGYCLLAFVGLAIVGIPLSVYRGASLFGTAQYAAWLAAFGLGADLARRPGGPLKLVVAILLGVVGAAVVGAQATLWNGIRLGDWHWRTFGTFVQPNLYAGCLLFGIPLALALALHLPGSAAILPGFAFLLMLSQLLFTGSRGGVLILPATLLVFFALAGWRGELAGSAAWRRVWLLLALAAPVMLLSTAALRERGEARVERTAPNPLCPPQRIGGTSASNAFRVLTWKGTLAMARARPLTGFGAGTFEYVHPRYALAGFTRRAHQGYLQYAAELGFPALLLWLGALAAAAVALVRAPRGSPERWWIPGAAAALAAAAAHNLIDYSWDVAGTALPFWALLGLAAAASTGPRRPDGTGGERPLAGRSSLARRRAPPWLWLLAAAPFAAVGLQSGAAAYLDERAMDAARVGAPAVARRDLDQAEKWAPWSARIQADLAGTWLQEGEPRGAIAAYRRAIARAPTHSPLHYRLGRTLEQTGDLPAAIREYKAGLRWAPHSPEVLLALGQALEKRGDREAAVRVFRRLVSVEQSDHGRVRAVGEIPEYRFAAAHDRLGETAMAAGNREDARRERLAAACGYAHARRAAANAGAYLAGVGLMDAETLKRLRERELELWQWLAGEYQRGSDAARAAAARALADEAGAASDAAPR